MSQFDNSIIKNTFISTFILLFMLLIGCNRINNCPQNINILPMYGNVKKCGEQLQIDKDFIHECDSLFHNDRSKAAEYHINFGWDHFYKNDLNNAMKRFNQAWLLDSINANIYWGFGSILGMKGEYEKSLSYFEKSILMNPNNEKVYECIATSYGNMFFQTKDINYLKKSIHYLYKSIKLRPNNPEAYAKLTGCYSYFIQTDSVKKYLKYTDSLDQNAITPEIRKSIMQSIHSSDSLKLTISKSITQ
jgi:tetratricopeptide (TPR) repeat protein